jgi:hypothetical protein
MIITGVIGAGVIVVVVAVVALGLTGRYDRYFTVTLVNRTPHRVYVVNHGTSYELLPGATDEEFGSSTVAQRLTVQWRGVRTCVNLLFHDAPTQPLAIRLVGGSLAVPHAPQC